MWLQAAPWYELGAKGAIIHNALAWPYPSAFFTRGPRPRARNAHAPHHQRHVLRAGLLGGAPCPPLVLWGAAVGPCPWPPACLR